MVLHEATRTGGFGGELAALVQARCFFHLEAPVVRVTGWDTPYPHSLARAYFPGPARLRDAFSQILDVRSFLARYDSRCPTRRRKRNLLFNRSSYRSRVGL